MLSVRAFVVLTVCMFCFGRAWAYQPPVDHSESQKARVELNKANIELKKAIEQKKITASRLLREAQNSQEYKAGIADHQKSVEDLALARKPVLEAMNQKPEYRTALVTKEQANAKLQKIKASVTATFADREAAATEAMNAGAALSRMEKEALDATPAVKEATDRVTAARQKLNQLEKDMNDSMRNNADWQAANTLIEEKNAAIKAAEEALNAAIEKETKAERERQDKINQEIQRRRNNW